MHIVCFGDSNTYGYDPRSYLGGRYPANIRWTDRLASATGWTVENVGMNGRSIPTGFSGKLPPGDVLVVMLGSNDLLCGLSPDVAVLRMESFLQQILPFYSQCLLVAPPHMQPGEWVTEDRLLTDCVQLTAHYQTLAQQLNIGFADSGAWSVDLTFDGVHFSPAGHAAFAAGITAALKSFDL